MDKATAGKLLAIMNEHGMYETLSTGADDRVRVYLHAVDLLPSLRRDVQQRLESDGWATHLRRTHEVLGDAVELADLLDSVRPVSGAWDA